MQGFWLPGSTFVIYCEKKFSSFPKTGPIVFPQRPDLGVWRVK